MLDGKFPSRPHRALRPRKGARMNLLKAAATVSGFTLLSRITGLIRETLIAAVFGASALTDAFFVAFRLPNMLRRLFAEGAFSQAFVPLLGAAELVAAVLAGQHQRRRGADAPGTAVVDEHPALVRALGEERHADQEQERQGKHLQGRVPFDVVADGPGKQQHHAERDHHGRDHHPELVGHADGGDDGVPRLSRVLVAVA